jgi:hypothetical protein
LRGDLLGNPAPLPVPDTAKGLVWLVREDGVVEGSNLDIQPVMGGPWVDANGRVWQPKDKAIRLAPSSSGSSPGMASRRRVGRLW